MPDITAEMEILNSPSPETSSGSVDTSESSAPIEGQPEQGEETQFEQQQPEVQVRPQADRQQQPGKPQDKTQQAKPTDPAQEAASYAELFPQGIEQAREVFSKAQQMDKESAALASGDGSQIAEIIPDIFDGNPSGEAMALRVGMLHLEQTSPEHFSQFSRMLVGDELAQSGLWDAVQSLYDSAVRAGDKGTEQLLERLASGLHEMYGLGPVTAESQSAEMKNYTTNLGTMLDRDVPAAIAQAFGPKFNSLHPQDRQAVLQAIKLDIRDRLSNDKAVTAAFQQLAKSYSAKEGARIYYDVLEPKFLSLAKMLARNYAQQNFEYATPQTRPQPAQRPAQQTRAKPKSMAEYHAEKKTIGEITREVLGELDESNPLQAGGDEANRMTDLELLSSNRAGKPRPKVQPGSELDA